MADPTLNPAGATGAGNAEPSFSALNSDISGINAQFDPQINDERGVAQRYEQKSVDASEQEASEAEHASGDLSADNQQMDNWLSSTPTRQAAYSTAMHAAPILSILTALGGKFTRLNGMQMLSATTGIVEGMNKGAEQQYTDAYNKWMQGYQRLKDHNTQLMQAHSLMLDAYKGRADAYQKASEAARRQTGDLLDQKQQAIANKVNTFKAQSEAMARLDRAAYAMQSLHERQLKDIAQVDHWKKMEEKSAALSPEKKAQLAANKQKWGNAKAQVDELMKQRGQVNSNLDMPAEAKAAALQSIDDRVQALEIGMDSAVAEAEAITASPTVNPEGKSPDAAAAQGPGVAQPAAAAGLPPPALQQLKQHQGKPVKFGNGQTWIMDPSGNVKQVQ